MKTVRKFYQNRIMSILFVLVLTIGFFAIVTTTLNLNTVSAKAITIEKVKADKSWTLTVANPKTQIIKVLDYDGNVVKNIKITVKGKQTTITPPKDGWSKDEIYKIVLITKNGKTQTTKTLKSFQVEEVVVPTIPTISSVDDIEVNINQKDSYILPDTVLVNMSDNTTQNIPVAWDSSIIDTSKVGIYTFNGSIKGYDKKIVLNLNINSIIISYENNFIISINIGEVPNLPKTVKVTMSDKSIVNKLVSWNNPNYDLSIAGDYKYEGTIEGMIDKPILTLKVNPNKADLEAYKPKDWNNSIVISNKAKDLIGNTNFINEDNIYLNFAFNNKGYIDINPNIDLKIYIDDKEYNSFVYDKIIKSNYYFAYNDYNIGVLSNGSHIIKVIADPNSKIDEITRDNNTCIITINISGNTDLSKYIGITYDNLAREPNKYINTECEFIGKVVEVRDNGINGYIRVDITKGNYDIYKDTVWVNYFIKSNDKRILEGDIVKVYGRMKGLKTYISVLNAQITLPEINASVIEMQNFTVNIITPTPVVPVIVPITPVTPVTPIAPIITKPDINSPINQQIKTNYENQLQALQTRIQNLKNNKTIQNLIKEADGSWNYIYVVDQDAVNSTQKEYDNLNLLFLQWEASFK